MSALRILGSMMVVSWLVIGCSSAKKIEAGATCILNTDCTNPLVCTMDKCHDACHGTADCRAGESCVKTAQGTVCQLPTEVSCAQTICGGTLVCASDLRCRAGCLSAADCADRQVCVSGVCADTTELNNGQLPQLGAKAAAGGACILDSDCQQALVCTLGKCHDACRATADCPTGQSCVKTNSSTVCQLPTEADCSRTTCGGAFVCASDLRCRTGCQSAMDCATGQVCVGGVCADLTDLDIHGQLPQKGPGPAADAGVDLRASDPGAKDGGVDLAGAGADASGGAGGTDAQAFDFSTGGTGGSADGGAGNAAACVAVPEGIVAWWTGNSTFDSVVLPQYNAAGYGVTFAQGVVGNAFFFNGSASATVASSPGLNLTSGLTIEGWIKPQMDGKLHILAKWGDSGAWAHQREYSLHMLPGGALRFAIASELRQDDTSLHIFDTPPGALPLASWSHIAATFDGSTGTRVVYVNGVEVAKRQDGPLALFTGGADLGIGAQMSAPGLPHDPFSGEIDEISLYNRPLTASQVQAIYSAGAAGKCRD